jgi:hypothetical protein
MPTPRKCCPPEIRSAALNWAVETKYFGHRLQQNFGDMISGPVKAARARAIVNN